MFFALAAVLLFFCSMTSPLFPIHNRVDQSIFMTLGKEIVHGKVLYRDLFEQKGPVIYFIHALAYLITGNNFYGVYLIQIPVIGFTMVYIDKIAGLYAPRRVAAAITAVAAVIILTCGCFLRGDNVEEFCLPLWAFAMYHLLAESRRPAGSSTPLWLFFIGGIMAGAVLWTKFTLLGFWAVWGLILAVRLIAARKIGRAISGGLLFAAGMVAATLPWILYFGYHGAVYDWLYVSLYVNITCYSSTIHTLLRPLFPVGTAAVNLIFNPLLSVIMFLGIRDMFRRKKESRIGMSVRERRAVWIPFAALYFGMYIGGRYYDYYLLMAAGYCVFGLLYVYHWWKDSPRLHGLNKWSRRRKTAAVVSAVLSAAIVGSNCLPYYIWSREKYVQFAFADVMRQGENPTLLNYGFVDGGLYIASNTSPLTKYTGTLNIDYERYPEMDDEMRGMIAAGVPEYVMIRMKFSESFEHYDMPELEMNYYPVAEGENKPDRYRYMLLRRKTNTEKE